MISSAFGSPKYSYAVARSSVKFTVEFATSVPMQLFELSFRFHGSELRSHPVHTEVCVYIYIYIYV